MANFANIDCELCPGVVAGTCVVLREDTLVYAGPLASCLDIGAGDGSLVLLSPADFDLLRQHVIGKRH